jgi:hypothetical protein
MDRETDFRTRWTSFPELFGEDLGPPVFTDQPPEPNKSARQHAARVRQDEQDAATERAKIAELFRKRAEREAADPLRGVPTAEINAARRARAHARAREES